MLWYPKAGSLGLALRLRADETIHPTLRDETAKDGAPELSWLVEISRVRHSAISEVLVGRFPAAERVFVDFHVDAFASKLYSLDAEAKSLFGCGFTP